MEPYQEIGVALFACAHTMFCVGVVGMGLCFCPRLSLCLAATPLARAADAQGRSMGVSKRCPACDPQVPIGRPECVIPM